MSIFKRILFFYLMIFLSISCNEESKDASKAAQGTNSNNNQKNNSGNNQNQSAKKCQLSTWDGKTPIFKDQTAKWGLEKIKALGNRISAADFNNDGFADLIVRKSGTGSDEISENGKRRTWFLLNTGKGSFKDVTLSSGILVRRNEDGKLARPMEVVAIADVNNDGNLDLYSGTNTTAKGKVAGESSEILLGDGAGKFKLAKSSELRQNGGPHAPAGASFTDFNLDGMVDLWIGMHNYSLGGKTIYASDRLYKGDGSGAFWDHSIPSALVTKDWLDLKEINKAMAHSRSWSTAACDLNGDGLPELLSASYGRAPNHLFSAQKSNNGQVSFINRSVSSGYAFDGNKNWQDNQFALCFCSKNPNAEGCQNIGKAQINCSQQNWNHNYDRQDFRLGGNSGTTVCADLNNDGHLDLLTTEITHWWAGKNSDQSEILINQGQKDVSFTRPGPNATGLNFKHNSSNWDQGHMTAAVFDFDNDGLQDIFIGGSDYPGNRALLFKNKGSAKFEELPPQKWLEFNRAHGMAVADFDGDGDLDLVVGHSRNRCNKNAANNCYESAHLRFFENQMPKGENWVKFKLSGGPGVNGAAIGARIQVKTKNLLQTQEVGGGHGHYGLQNELTLHFGLADSCEADAEIRWPNKELKIQKLKINAGKTYSISFK